MSNNPFLAIVVIYNCSIKSSKSLITLNESAKNAGQIIEVFIYDNSPIAQDTIAEPKLYFSNLSIAYFSDTLNSGLSIAYNFGADIARQKNYNWILLLDQDTSISIDFVKISTEAMRAYPNVKLFCPKLYLKNGSLFSPCFYFFKRGFQLKHINSGLSSLKRLSPVNSGMLISLPHFFEVGGYNEKVKLDFSDFQFIDRFKRKNHFFFILATRFVQDFSNDESDQFVLNKRYENYCISARNCEKLSLLDRFQYFLVVLARGAMLTKRYRRLIFFKTFFSKYLC